jgi:hypothetical protein
VQIAGERIQVKGQIDWHLRAFGEHIELHAPIFGSAYVRGETVVIASAIHQDLDIKAHIIRNDRTQRARLNYAYQRGSRNHGPRAYRAF